MAAFASDALAREAARALGDEGRGDRIAVLSAAGDVTSEGVTVGAGTQSLLGLVASTGALGIPAIGPFLAMGPLAATLGGATAGGLAGLFADTPVPLRPPAGGPAGTGVGQAAVVVETGDAPRVASLLRAEGALTVRTLHGGGMHDG